MRAWVLERLFVAAFAFTVVLGTVGSAFAGSGHGCDDVYYTDDSSNRSLKHFVGVSGAFAMAGESEYDYTTVVDAPMVPIGFSYSENYSDTFTVKHAKSGSVSLLGGYMFSDMIGVEAGAYFLIPETVKRKCDGSSLYKKYAFHGFLDGLSVYKISRFTPNVGVGVGFGVVSLKVDDPKTSAAACASEEQGLKNLISALDTLFGASGRADPDPVKILGTSRITKFVAFYKVKAGVGMNFGPMDRFNIGIGYQFTGSMNKPEFKPSKTLTDPRAFEDDFAKCKGCEAKTEPFVKSLTLINDIKATFKINF